MKKKIPRPWKTVLTVLGFFVIVLVVAVVWIAIWVQSESGQTWLAKVVSRMASSETQQVRLEKLLVTPRGLIRLGSFQIEDAEGVWLHGENLEIRLDLYELVNKKLLVEKARLESITMTKSPQTGPPDDDDRPFRVIIPPLPRVELQHFDVDRATLEPPVIGVKQVFGLKAYADLGGSKSIAVVEADRLEGPGGLAKVRAELDGATENLDLKVLIEEAPGGVAPKALGLASSGIKAELTGTGPVDRLEGRINIAVAEAGTLEADYSFKQTDDISLDLHGKSSISPSLAPERFTPLLRDPAKFSMRFVSGESGLAVENLEIQAPAARLSAKVKAGPELERAVGGFRLEILQALPPEMLNGLALEAGSLLTGSLEEAEGKQALTISANIPKADFKDLGVTKADLEVRLTNTGGVKEPLAGLRASGDLRMAELRLSKDQPPLQDIRTRFNLDMLVNRLNIQSLEIEAPWLKSNIHGHVTLDDLLADLEAEVRIPDIVKAPFPTGLSGGLQLSSHVTGNFSGPDLAITAGGELSDLGGLPDSAKRLTGDRLTLSAKAALQQSQLQLQDLSITGLSRLTADGRMDFNTQSMEAAFRVVLPEKVEFPFASPVTISGPTLVQGSLSGPLDGFDLRMQAEASKLESNGQILAKPQMRVQMSGLPSKINVRAELESGTTGGPVKAFGDFQLNKTTVQLSDFQAQAPGAKITADAVLNKRTGLTNGKAVFSVQDLALIGAFTGLKLSGSTKGSVTFEARQATQFMDIDLEANNLAVNEIRSNRLTVKAQQLAIGGTPSGQARVDVAGMQSGDLRLNTIGLNVESREGGARIAGRAEGKWNHPLSLSFDALVEKSGATNRLTLNRLNAKIGKYGVNQDHALRLSYSQNEVAVRDLDLTIGPGRIQGNGKLAGTGVETDLNVVGLPLEIATLFTDTGLVGIIDGRFKLNGPASSPVGDAKLNIKNVRPAGPDYKTVPPVSVALDLNLDRGLLVGKADITGLSEDPGRADFSLPFRLSVKPFNAAVPKDGALSGSMSAKVNLSFLPVLLALDNQSLTGLAQADLAISGKINNPQINGRAVIADGRYENIRIGALFDKINAEIKAEGSRLEITKATATDGEGGQIQAQGKIDVNPGAKYPYHLALNFQGAKLIRLDLLNARCWGDLDLKGNSAGADLSGNIKMDPIVLTIPKQSGPDVPNLEIQEINAPAGATAPPTKKTGGYRLNLDVNLEMPGRAHVRGRGLDTEWQGSLKVQGMSAAPKVKGRLDLVRGRFDFLGRTFRLTEGTLVFSGVYPPLPFINVTGEATAGEIVALVTITGPATSPKLELSSTPALPQDEILSRVLFGRNLNTISAFQALRLAQAANQLAGGGGPDLDFMGKARDTLHLDDIDIGQTDEGSSTVGVGKYINEDIYVRAEKDLSPGDGSVTVEIEVGPSFSLETQTGGASGGKFGANWKKDY